MAGEVREARGRASEGRKAGGGESTEAETRWAAAIAALRSCGACIGGLPAAAEIGTAVSGGDDGLWQVGLIDKATLRRWAHLSENF